MNNSKVSQVLLAKFNRYHFLLIATSILLVSLLSYYHNDFKFPRNYHYEKQKASNGVLLHTIRTTPDNIRLQAIDTNVTKTSYYGINGGFFWEGALLSIAVMNDQPLQGLPGDYGSGWYNTGIDTNLKRGTLVWDDITQHFSIQVVTHAGELTVTDKHHYWAQGGVSMRLNDSTRWENDMILEEMPAYDERRMRTAIVYDHLENMYMIVTPTSCTIAEFRAAILETLGDRKLVDGIYLDGDGSSQMQCRYIRLHGDQRQIYQMLTLIQ
ncbi:hypothetical protein [Paenibacillus qinlingensis]|uniref:Phosphodiester glycosidase domain-containing protein n=1 Tax=Paenibacillus qinlingensis TaxID=1837343 RepID=A0ABU1NZX2_9BACL|nr:hypothetical protein [Paenibacillus qinlingensis]MDR6552636.1 hypothetical protein [Paenibacillus qinlingensis]